MTPDELVTEFCRRWADPDPAVLASYFTDDAVYHNIPMEPVRGRAAIEEFIAGFVASFGGIDFRIRHQAVHGGVVLNERVDVFTIGGRTVELPVMGAFEVVDGRIAGWRDYFDMAPIAEAAQQDPAD
ncbi:limonene-1,2-epoxide hydrolase [Rhodococcus sp. WB1]|uniref:limonene-1,2-epoxide hydrolase family protein n=1 Tax=Rhodococcus TaxID=1827 RepID=UPI00081A812A|nr:MULTISPECIES: limonene-1,2-epoxide hydrolase family protein [Rhodococcus]ANZ25749.1 limonene-1,2-epoxide hydrolase [Rhodococcus sp. WB1]QIX49983.1 SnoaL-like domain-containing protein [Rhodococcus sp. DMU1]UGQ39487.1 nuclear transport factor 2 family protein [Rhodococcus aetherivorans]